MSHIANALVLELKQTKKTAADLSRTTGINEAQISRIKSGDQVWIGSDDLVKLSNGLFPAQSKAATKCHARLLYARLQDEYSGIGAKFISIKLEADLAVPAAANCPKPVLPPKCSSNSMSLLITSPKIAMSVIWSKSSLTFAKVSHQLVS